MRALQRALAEQDAVIGDDADRITPDMRKAANQRLTIKLLELVEFRTIDQPGNDVPHVERPAAVGGNNTVDFLGRKQRLARLAHIELGLRLRLQRGNDPPRNPDRM